MRCFSRLRDRSPRCAASTRSSRSPASPARLVMLCTIAAMERVAFPSASSVVVSARRPPAMRALRLLVIVLGVLAAANSGRGPSYGEDPLTRRVERRLAEIFDHEVAVFPVATGTAANALALATLVPPWGAVYCHAEAHVVVDECGAPEFYAS